jgi:glutathione S-transferase
MAGETYTLADINYIPEISMLFYCGEGILITDRPNLKRWWEDVSSRPAIKKCLTRLHGAYDEAVKASTK